MGDVVDIHSLTRRRQAEAQAARQRVAEAKSVAQMQQIGSGYADLCHAILALAETEVDLAALLENTAQEVRRLDSLL